MSLDDAAAAVQVQQQDRCICAVTGNLSPAGGPVSATGACQRAGGRGGWPPADLVDGGRDSGEWFGWACGQVAVEGGAGQPDCLAAGHPMAGRRDHRGRAGAGGPWVLFVPAADWLAHHDVGSAKGPLLQMARDAARGRLLTLGAGLFAAGALVFTVRNFTLSREGQVTDRYTKAITQLGDETLNVRVGGIYALERVARDSAKNS